MLVALVQPRRRRPVYGIAARGAVDGGDRGGADALAADPSIAAALPAAAPVTREVPAALVASCASRCPGAGYQQHEDGKKMIRMKPPSS
jgi:hypothetical protein